MSYYKITFKLYIISVSERVDYLCKIKKPLFKAITMNNNNKNLS